MSEKLQGAPIQNDQEIPNLTNEREQYLKEIEHLTDEEIHSRIKMLENNMRIMRSEYDEVKHGCAELSVKIDENNEKIKNNKQLPYLVSNIVEILEVEPDEAELEDQGATDLNNQISGKCVIIKTTTRQTIF